MIEGKVNRTDNDVGDNSRPAASDNDICDEDLRENDACDHDFLGNGNSTVIDPRQ
jgi:hypothetical protein